jgi:hypothetical protein
MAGTVVAVIVILGTFPEITGPAHAGQTIIPMRRIRKKILCVTAGTRPVEKRLSHIVRISHTHLPVYPGIKCRGGGCLMNLCKHETQPDLHGKED